MAALRVSYQGEPGAYSEDAARRYFAGSDIELRPCATFADAMRAVKDGVADHAVIPIENSLGGSIHAAYDSLLSSGLFIIGELDYRVRHALLAPKGVDITDVHYVLSHPQCRQALAQCADFLGSRGIHPVPHADTAGAAASVAAERPPATAALASVIAARLHGLDVLHMDCQDEAENFTRFIVLGPTPRMPALGTTCKTSLVFALRDNVPGALFKALAVFALRDIDLTKIESRPGKSLPGRLQPSTPFAPLRYKYCFYLDIVAHCEERSTVNALNHLRELFDFVRVLGTYQSGPAVHNGPTIEGDGNVGMRQPISRPLTGTGPSPLTIAIIGFGTFGQFLAAKIRPLAHRIVAFDFLSDCHAAGAAIGADVADSLDDVFTAHPDVIVVAVSILSFQDVIGKLALGDRYRTTGSVLLVDVLSVKAHPREVLLGHGLPESVDILCTHPMFGPQSAAVSCEGLPFVYDPVRVRDSYRCKGFLDMFRQLGCSMVEMSSEEHDAIAASTQFITHFTGRVLSQLRLKPSAIATRGFLMLLDLVRNTCADSDDLFYALYRFNPRSGAQLAAFRKAVQHVTEVLERGDRDQCHGQESAQQQEGTI
ncbi:Prephenate dehydrogenase [Plasmodiophora brassicae]